MKLEVCMEARGPVSTAEQAVAARDGGAATIELGRDMSAAGLTPADDDIRAARAALGGWKGLMVMIRPRAGDFFASADERQEMAEAIDRVAACGADGVVLGCLRPEDRGVDGPGLAPLLARARGHGLVTTFHRAFDAASDRAAALEEIVSLGFDRVLTSGMPWGASGTTAQSGLAAVRRTIIQARGRIEVVIGGGIDLSNVHCITQGLRDLGRQGRGWSLHCHAGVLSGGAVDQRRVQELARAAVSA